MFANAKLMWMHWILFTQDDLWFQLHLEFVFISRICSAADDLLKFCAPAIQDVRLGPHRSILVAERDMRLVFVKLERLRRAGCPFIPLNKKSKWGVMQSYFVKLASEMEVTSRSSKSMDFQKSLLTMTPSERKVLIASMADEVCFKVVDVGRKEIFNCWTAIGHV